MTLTYHISLLIFKAGPLTNIHIPSDRATGRNKTFAFISYRHSCSVKYACELFNTLKLFRRSIYCKPTEQKTPVAESTKDNTGSPNYSTPSRPGDRIQQQSPLATPQLYSSNRESSQDSERRRYGSDFRRSENYNDRRQYDDRSQGRYDNQQSHGSGPWAYGGGNPHQQSQWSPMGQVFPGQNYDRNSPNYGPMRNDSQRNNSHRNNRRQNSQPY